jgi:hypothetical protein
MANNKIWIRTLGFAALLVLLAAWGDIGAVHGRTIPVSPMGKVRSVKVAVQLARAHPGCRV